MYAQHFGLAREPFSLAPDPRFLFMSESHREALAHLLYGVGGGGGFVVLTGEIGAGKTTVARAFLEQLPTHCRVAYIYNPSLSVIELLQAICSEFAIADLPPQAGGRFYVEALNAFLLKGHAQGKQALLVIDEAQALQPAVLEQLRLLTNLETAERKLLQIILIGQPELRDMLAQPGLEQLSQRVIARYHLGPLSPADTRAYLEHRLAVAGGLGGAAPPNPFDAGAMAALHRLSGGVPRRLNLLADRALLGAYGRSRRTVDRATVQRAAVEVLGQLPGGSRVWWPAALAAGLVLGLAGAAWWWGPWRQAPLPVAAAPVAGAQPRTVPADPAASAAALAAPVVPAPPLPVPPSDSAVDLLAAAHADDAIAWRELALRWGVAIGEGEPCRVAEQQAQLGCWRNERAERGDLRLLRTLGRPALLTLRTSTNLRVYALLVALGDKDATLQVGQRRFVITLPALAGAWRGEFATWWRQPPGWKAGERTPTPAARDWISAQIVRLMPEVSGKPFRDQVAAFQIGQGLPADGVPSAPMLMVLNRQAGVAEPPLPPALPPLPGG